MIQVNIKDGCFTTASGYAGERSGENPVYLRWNRSEQLVAGACFFTDTNLMRAFEPQFDDRLRIAWLYEPPSLSRTHYDLIEKIYDRFDYVLTFDLNLIDKYAYLHRSCRFLFYPLGGSWIKPEDWYQGFYKTKNLSIIASQKVGAPGHKLRHAIIEALRVNHIDIDVYGHGYNPIASKLTALRDYRYSIVVESIKMRGYFSEKLIDCLSQNTVPIYWGANVWDYFDARGIITFNDIDDLLAMLITNNDTDFTDDYNNHHHFIGVNNTLCNRYQCAEDWIYQHYPFLFEGCVP